MRIHMTRVSPETHVLAYEREDGTREKNEIHTRSFLLHDLVHFALESEVGVQNGFFGLLAQGYTFADLSGKGVLEHSDEETRVVEMVVGPLSSMLEKGGSIDEFMTTMQNMFTAHDMPMPEWLTKELVQRVSEKYRALKGKWNSLNFGETLELEF